MSRSLLILCLTLLPLSAFAQCDTGKTVFECTTKQVKRIQVCDLGPEISYSFGKVGSPELAVAVPRHKASTSQWHGVGSSIFYSVTIPNENATYEVFHSAYQCSNNPNAGKYSCTAAGVEVQVNQAQVASIACDFKRPVIMEIEGIDLPQ